MDERERANVFRLWALEILVSMQGAALHAATADPKGSLAAFRKTLLEAVRTQGFPGLDAAVSDFASAELEAALDRLLAQQAAYLAAVAKPDE